MREPLEELLAETAFEWTADERSYGGEDSPYPPDHNWAESASVNGSGPAVDVKGSESAAAPVFVTLREFLPMPFAAAESLVGVGRQGTNVLPRFGWVILWGPEGSGKTSVVGDLVAHTAAGLDWLAYPTLREVRWVVVVNEGVPGGLQDKLAQKFEGWEEAHEGILDRIAVYTSPWGAFTLQSERMLARLRDYAHDFDADYVVLDPLHTVGTVGAGSPQDTEQFKHLLRQLGLWESLGILTPHHSNKAGMVSGDWGRHPDTLIRLEKDGARPATRYTLQKARPADPAELGVTQILEWETDTLGYCRIQNAARSPKKIGKNNKQKVLDAASEGLTSIAEIALRTSLSDRTVTKHLKTLEEDGELTLTEGTNRKLTVATMGDEEGPDDE